LKRLHDKTRFSDNDLGKHINTLYRNRKLKVQEAINRKEQVFQMKQFYDKCINSKNKMTGFVSKIDQNLITSDTLISLNIHRENIKSVLESLMSGKACGIDEIPNEFLKYGGSTLITKGNPLLDLFSKITDPEKNHRRLAQGNHKAYPQGKINV
jgi:hypothetical protein